MAEYTIPSGKVGVYSKTLVAETADTVTFGVAVSAVEVLNKSGTASIYFTTDGSAPTVNGQNCHELPALSSARTVETASKPDEATVVKLISAGTPEYSVVRDSGAGSL